MWNGYKVVDADAHMHEPQDMWEKYVEPNYRPQAPKVDRFGHLPTGMRSPRSRLRHSRYPSSHGEIHAFGPRSRQAMWGRATR